MLNFLVKTSAFLLVNALLVVLIHNLVSIHFIAKAVIPTKYDTTTIVVGHSHSANAINDSLLHGIENCSGSGESYYYIYHKLRIILKSNPSIDTVIVSFTNKSISSKTDEWIWNDANISARIANYGLIIPTSELFPVLSRNPTGVITQYPLFLQKAVDRLKTNDYNMAQIKGGYQHNCEKHKSSGEIHPSIDIPTMNSESENFVYLKKIIDLCTRKNKIIVLIRLPQMKEVRNAHDEFLFKNVLRSNFSTMFFIDFNDFLSNEEDFSDFEHVNCFGAAKVSRMLRWELDNLQVSKKKDCFSDK